MGKQNFKVEGVLVLRYFYDSVKLRTEELAELAENSREDGDPNDAFSQSRRTFGIVLCTHRFSLVHISNCTCFETD